MDDVLGDGSIIQDGMRLKPRSQAPERDLSFIPYPVRGHVLAVFATDDEKNRDAETYLCDVQIISLGITLFKVPFGLDKADVENYVSYSPVAASKNLNFLPFDPLRVNPKYSNGTTVMVQFLDGDVRQPFITKVLPHYQSGSEGLNPSPRPSKADGDVYNIHYNGIDFLIDKDGNWTVEQTLEFDPLFQKKYGKKFTFKLKNPLPISLLQDLVFTMDNSDGGTVAITATDKLGHVQSVTFDAAAKSFEIDSQNVLGGTTMTLNPDGFELDHRGGIVQNSVKLDSAGITLTTNKDQLLDITGDYKLSATGSVELKAITGNLKGKAPLGSVELEGSGGAKLKLGTGMVGIGGPAAELLDLLDQSLQQLDTLLTAMQAETHLGNLGYSSSPPLNASAYAATQIQLSVIKGLLGAIKGGI